MYSQQVQEKERTNQPFNDMNNVYFGYYYLYHYPGRGEQFLWGTVLLKFHFHLLLHCIKDNAMVFTTACTVRTNTTHLHTKTHTHFKRGSSLSRKTEGEVISCVHFLVPLFTIRSGTKLHKYVQSIYFYQKQSSTSCTSSSNRGIPAYQTNRSSTQ